MTASKLFAWAALLLFVIAGLSACAHAAAATPLPKEVNVTVTASEFKYEPATITVRTGQTVNLTFKNGGTVIHEFRLLDLDPRVETKAEPGDSDTVTFTAPVAGSYKFVCLIPGHEAMVGELIVQ